MPPPSLPDHLVLSTMFVKSHFELLREKDASKDTPRPPDIRPRLKLSKIGSEFMMSYETFRLLTETIERLETDVASKHELDK